MFRKLRGSLTYANVMVTLLVFVVLGGGAYAAFTLPKNSVRSKNIVNNQVRGKDVKESSLRQVPSAANGARRIDFNHAATDPVVTGDNPAAHLLLKVHELKVRASCFTSGGHTGVYVSMTSSKPALIDNWGVKKGAAYSNGRLLTAGATYAPINNTTTGGSFDDDETAVYRNSKRTITMTLDTTASDHPGIPVDCLVHGDAVSAPK